jgi:hypothetical protein
VDEYLCLTLLARPGEGQADFAARLSRFWTHMLRNRLDDYEKVYAESRAFDHSAGRLSRQYLVQEDMVAILESELQQAGIDHEPIDRDELYSRYEAVPSEWMQIEH